MRERIVWLAAAALIAGCPTKRDYGLGECTEYKPMCVTGPMRCETDERGCEVCTCEDPREPPRSTPEPRGL